MAAPPKKHADYFPFYAKDGKTLRILEGKYRCKGTGFFINLLRLLSLTPEHHIIIEDEADFLDFYTAVKCDEECGFDMLNIMVKTKKIDPGLWKNHRVIVCEDLLLSVNDAYRNRKNKIITMDEIRLKFKSDVINGVSDVIITQETPVYTPINPQSKVDYTKQNKESNLPGLKILPNQEDNQTKEQKAQNFFLPSKEEILNFSLTKIEECIEILCYKIHYEKVWDEVYKFKGKNLKSCKNERAILHVLIAIYTVKKKPSNYWKYATSILNKEDLTYNERDNTRNS